MVAQMRKQFTLERPHSVTNMVAKILAGQ